MAVAVLAGCYLLSFRPLSRPVVLDPATWDYMSLGLLEGRVPYRDVFLHKTPGAMFFGAAGGATAALFDAPPLLGVHAAFLALGATGAALTYLLLRRRGRSGLVAFAAACWLLSVDQWSLAAIEGARPKVATTTLGLAALLLATRRPLLSGIFGAGATLCWQPGLVFLMGSVAELWRHGTGTAGRSRKLAVLSLGAALPVCALLVYLALNGALRSFFEQAVLFNTHYIEIHARTPADTGARLWALTKQWNPIEIILLPAAVTGLVVAKKSPPLGLTVATTAYFTLVFVSIQAWPDTILFAPLIAVVLAEGIAGLLARVVRSTAAAAVGVSLALATLATPGSAKFFPPITLSEQHAFMQDLAADLSPRDSVYVVSCPEFLIHTGRHSVLPWPYMWFGVDEFAASHTEGGFDEILRTLAAHDPKLMIVCRRWSGDLRRRFEEWARGRYDRQIVRFYPHTKRPMTVYRRRGQGR